MTSRRDYTLIRCIETSVRELMGDQQAGHGLDHVMRVTSMAKQLHTAEGGNGLTIELAALLHDVGDAKFHDGVEKSGEISRELLGQQNASEALIEHVAQIVDNISFRKGVDPNTLSLEGQIVQDADRLDALGAIGIVRTIEYGVSVGQPFHSNRSNTEKTGAEKTGAEKTVTGKTGAGKTGIQHFDDKLFKLKSLLNTESAKKVAEQREDFMRQFVRQFLAEWDEGSSTMAS